MEFEKDEKEEKVRRKEEKKRKKRDKKERKRDKKERNVKRRRSSSSSDDDSSNDNDNNINNKYQKHNNNDNNKINKDISISTEYKQSNNNNDNKDKYAVNEVKETIPVDENITKIVTKSKLDFFSSLIANELNVPQIGTIHAKGKTDNNDDKERTRGWLCLKCDTSNATFNLQCSKCRAMKRFDKTHRSER